jgi:hypothetical protein
MSSLLPDISDTERELEKSKDIRDTKPKPLTGDNLDDYEAGINAGCDKCDDILGRDFGPGTFFGALEPEVISLPGQTIVSGMESFAESAHIICDPDQTPNPTTEQKQSAANQVKTISANRQAALNDTG